MVSFPGGQRQVGLSQGNLSRGEGRFPTVAPSAERTLSTLESAVGSGEPLEMIVVPAWRVLDFVLCCPVPVPGGSPQPASFPSCTCQGYRPVRMLCGEPATGQWGCLALKIFSARRHTARKAPLSTFSWRRTRVLSRACQGFFLVPRTVVELPSGTHRFEAWTHRGHRRFTGQPEIEGLLPRWTIRSDVYHDKTMARGDFHVNVVEAIDGSGRACGVITPSTTPTGKST